MRSSFERETQAAPTMTRTGSEALRKHPRDSRNGHLKKAKLHRRQRRGSRFVSVIRSSTRKRSLSTGFSGATLVHTFTATSPTPPVTWELVDPPAWLTLDGAMLSGMPPEFGVFEVDVVASLDELSASQTLVITVRPLIELPSEVEGWQGNPLLERLRYNGPCEVEQWYLSGAPPRVEIGALGCSDNVYANSHNVVGITGIPGESGFFDATITAHVCCGGVARTAPHKRSLQNQWRAVPRMAALRPHVV